MVPWLPPRRSDATLAMMRGSIWLVLLGVAAGGCDDHQVDCTAAGVVCTLAGTGDAAFNGDGKPAAETALYLPSQVRRGPDGLVYVMDFNNHRLRRIEADGRVTTIAGDGFHAPAIEGVPATESSLENPVDFDFLPDGRIVMVSYHDPRVLRLELDGTLTTIAGGPALAELPGQGDGGPALAARFIELRGIAVAPDGAIYLADAGAHRIRVVRGTMVSSAAGSTRGFDGDGGAATASMLDTPSALAFGPDGTLYVADSANCAVRQIAADGSISTVAGTGAPGFSGDGQLAVNAELSHPEGIALADDGTLYIADRFNSRLRSVGLDGTITTIAGTGERGYNGDGDAHVTQLGYTARIQVDGDKLLFGDQTNNLVRTLAR